jgi:hypothetical protein
LIGALLGLSSCAAAPTKPLGPGELKLLSMVVPEKENIRVNLSFVVNIRFEADGQPEIRSACFSFAGDGPHCVKVTDGHYGSPGTIRAQIHTKNPGSRLLQGYVLYIRDGKIQPTNTVSTYFPLRRSEEPLPIPMLKGCFFRGKGANLSELAPFCSWWSRGELPPTSG